MKKLNLDQLKKYRYPALILALGLLLLLIPAGGRDSRQEAEESALVQAEDGDGFDLDAFTRQAEDLLSDMQGAGQVRLLLTLETDGRRDYLSDVSESSSDSAGQSQTDAVLVSRGGDQYPVTVYRSYPKFRGAVVLCTGADSPGLILQIKEAVSSLTGLGMDKITVLKSA